MKDWLIRKLGGYADLKEAIEDIKNSEERHEILSLAFKEIFLPINPDDLLKIGDNGEWQFMGKPLRVEEVEKLKEDARTLSKMKLWHAIKLDVRYHLSRKMFEEARNKEDIIWGQLATFLWDVVKTRLNQLGQLK